MPFQSTAMTIDAGAKHLKPITVNVDPGGGDVQIQFRNAQGTFTTPAAAEYTISTAGPFLLTRANAPETRILATGDAQFEVTDQA